MAEMKSLTYPGPAVKCRVGSVVFKKGVPKTVNYSQFNAAMRAKLEKNGIAEASKAAVKKAEKARAERIAKPKPKPDEGTPAAKHIGTTRSRRVE